MHCSILERMVMLIIPCPFLHPALAIIGSELCIVVCWSIVVLIMSILCPVLAIIECELCIAVYWGKWSC